MKALARFFTGFIRRRALGLWLAALALGLDQLTKLWATGALVRGSQSIIDGLVAFTLSFNRGVAFSFLADIPHAHMPYYLAGFAGAVSVIFVIYMPTGSRLFQAGLGCIVGGAVGNMIDRIVFGGVIDFIHVYKGDWSFPVFNVADIAINIGVGLILLDALRQSKMTKTKTTNKQPEVY